ncbi:MAG TPA: archease [Verrucomicrobiae bacterium]|nr:archease [Verrucomicrobiae bacterium]
MTRWEHFAHGADVGVRGFGDTVEQAFEQAALALSAVVADISKIALKEAVEVLCDAPDRELLLVSWLNAIVYEMAVRKMVFGEFHVAITGNSLNGRFSGEEVDSKRHDVVVEVKGATVTALKVERTQDGGWLAQCVVDV